jgi:isocitrate/isopropylmalate dehydrogenase
VAVQSVLANPAHRTVDLGGTVGTGEMTRLIIEKLG